MKRIFCTLGMVCLTWSLHAQGTVIFANYVWGVLDAPVFEADYVTRVAGPEYIAQLYAGPDSSSLAPVGPPVPFLSGAGAGYFLGGTRVIPTVAPGNVAAVQVRYFRTRALSGDIALTGVSLVTTGGGGSPPTLPANLVGLTSVAFPEPEPPTTLLALLAAGLLFQFRRSHDKPGHPT